MSNHSFLRAQAAAYAQERIDAIPELRSPVFDEIRDLMATYIRVAYMQGADAGYTAAKSEEHK